jgi:hypothetical protein
MFNLSIPEQDKPAIYYSKLNLPAKIMAGKALNSGNALQNWSVMTK